MTYKFDYQYFGNVNYYYELIKLKYYEFELYDNYPKMSFRNRCRILGPNGPIDLSIPVVGGRENKMVMKDVRICYKENWSSRHLKTLISCYNRSPWFQEYRGRLEQLYRKKIEYLYEWNNFCHQFINEQLILHINKNNYRDPESVLGTDERGDFRGLYLPKQPNPMRIKFKPYPQVFSDRFGFVPDLSILDMLFCEGPRTLEALKLADRMA